MSGRASGRFCARAVRRAARVGKGLVDAMRCAVHEGPSERVHSWPSSRRHLGWASETNRPRAVRDRLLGDPCLSTLAWKVLPFSPAAAAQTPCRGSLKEALSVWCSVKDLELGECRSEGECRQSALRGRWVRRGRDGGSRSSGCHDGASTVGLGAVALESIDILACTLHRSPRCCLA